MCGHNSIPSIERADERESLAFGFPLRREASPLVNADQIVIGILRIISALISSLFLAIHKVFLRKTAFIRTQILSQSALADLISVYLRAGDGKTK